MGMKAPDVSLPPFSPTERESFFASIARHRRGAAWMARLAVFGWPALREKLRAADLGMNDVALECAKLILIEEVSAKPLEQGAELRLLGGEGDTVDMAWVVPDGDEIIEGMKVPMELYQGVADKLEDWEAVILQLESGPFVDILKLFMGEGRAETAA